MVKRSLRSAPNAYSISEAARRLGVHRHTVRYWMKKGWVHVRKDYRNYPVFTGEELKRIEQWRKTLRDA